MYLSEAIIYKTAQNPQPDPDEALYQEHAKEREAAGKAILFAKKIIIPHRKRVNRYNELTQRAATLSEQFQNTTDPGRRTLITNQLTAIKKTMAPLKRHIDIFNKESALREKYGLTYAKMQEEQAFIEKVYPESMKAFIGYLEKKNPKWVTEERHKIPPAEIENALAAAAKVGEEMSKKRFGADSIHGLFRGHMADQQQAYARYMEERANLVNASRYARDFFNKGELGVKEIEAFAKNNPEQAHLAPLIAQEWDNIRQGLPTYGGSMPGFYPKTVKEVLPEYSDRARTAALNIHMSEGPEGAQMYDWYPAAKWLEDNPRVRQAVMSGGGAALSMIPESVRGKMGNMSQDKLIGLLDMFQNRRDIAGGRIVDRWTNRWIGGARNAREAYNKGRSEGLKKFWGDHKGKILGGAALLGGLMLLRGMNPPQQQQQPGQQPGQQMAGGPQGEEGWTKPGFQSARRNPQQPYRYDTMPGANPMAQMNPFQSFMQSSPFGGRS
jgi:hypothetical protein